MTDYIYMPEAEAERLRRQERRFSAYAGFYPHELEPVGSFRFDETEQARWRIKSAERTIAEEQPGLVETQLRSAALNRLRHLDFERHESRRRRTQANIANSRTYPTIVPEITRKLAGQMEADPDGLHRPVNLRNLGARVVACLDCHWYESEDHGATHWTHWHATGAKHRALHMQPPATSLCTWHHPQAPELFLPKALPHQGTKLPAVQYPPVAVSYRQVRVSGHGWYEVWLCRHHIEEFDREHPNS